MGVQQEEWRPVVGHPSFAVSSEGVVARAVSGCGSMAGRRLKGWVNAGGYRMVTLDRAQFYVHRLVLEAFVGPCPPGMMGRHLDGDSQNPQLSNLAWGTTAENHADTVGHGRTTRGDRNRHARLGALQVRAMRSLAGQGVSRRRLATLFRVSYSHASSICAGRFWGWLS